MAFWALQIAFNGLWTPVFFGLQEHPAGHGGGDRGSGSACSCAMVALWQVDWIAGLLFVPYLVWVTIAAALNRSGGLAAG
jgi:translocator protein